MSDTGGVLGSLFFALPDLIEATASNIDKENASIANQHNKRGIDFLKQGKFNEAREAFAVGLLEIQQDSAVKASLLFNLSYTCAQLKEYADAIRWIDQALEIKTISPDTEFRLRAERAHCEFQQRDYRTAQKSYRNITNQFPGNKDIYVIYAGLVIISILLGDEDEARGWFNKLILFKHVDPPYIAALAFDAGSRLYKKGNYEQACLYFADTIAVQENYSNAHVALLFAGNCCANLNRTEQAQSFYEKSVEWPTAGNQFKAKIHYEIGVTDFKHKRLDKAYGHFLKAIDCQPQHPQLHLIYFYLGSILTQQAKTDEALDYFAKIQFCQSADELFKSRTQMEIGRVYFLSGRYSEAYDIYKNVIEIHSDDPAIYVIYQNIGSASYGLGRREEALAWYKRAIDHPHCDEETRKNLIDCLKNITTG